MKEKNSSGNFIKKLCLTSVMIALATTLSLVKIYHLPLGGSITLLSMVPIIFISLIYGVGWGMIGAFMYSLLQLALGILVDGLLGWGLSSTVLIGAILFDYIIAYSVLGIGGIFRKRGLSGILVGTALAMICRFTSHFISGCVFFKSFEVFNNPYIYSLCYNGSYMLPELIFTVIALLLLMKSKQFVILLNNN